MADVEYLFQSGKLTEQEQRQRRAHAKRVRFMVFFLCALACVGLWVIVGAAVAAPFLLHHL